MPLTVHLSKNDDDHGDGDGDGSDDFGIMYPVRNEVGKTYDHFTSYVSHREHLTCHSSPSLLFLSSWGKASLCWFHRYLQVKQKPFCRAKSEVETDLACTNECKAAPFQSLPRTGLKLWLPVRQKVYFISLYWLKLQFKRRKLTPVALLEKLLETTWYERRFGGSDWLLNRFQAGPKCFQLYIMKVHSSEKFRPN